MAKNSKKTVSTKNTAAKGAKSPKTTTKNKGAAKTKRSAKKTGKKQNQSEKENKKSVTKISDAKENSGISLRADITFILSLALMLIMTISNFGFCGPVGNGLSNLFFGVFGCVQYVMPLALFAGVAILIANDYNFLSIKKCIAGFVFLMTISAFAQVIYPGENIRVSDLLSLAINNHATGGIIGGSIGLGLKAMFGIAGAVIILFFIVVFSLIVLTQRSLAEFFKELVTQIKKSLEDGQEKRQEKAQRKQEEREEARKEEEVLYPEPADGEALLESTKEAPEKNDGTIKKWKQKFKRKNKTEEGIQEESAEKVSASESEEKSVQESLNDIHINIPDFVQGEREEHQSVQEMGENEYPISEEDGDAYDPLYADGFSMDSIDEKDIAIRENPDDQAQIIEAEENLAGDASPEQAKELLKTGTKKFQKREQNQKNGSSSSENHQMTVDEIQNLKQDDSKKKRKVKKAKKKDYILPPITLLDENRESLPAGYEKSLRETAVLLQQTLASFGVNVTMKDISCGPSVTRYEMTPEQGTKVSKIVNLTDDIKLNLAATDIRIEAPIPGKAAIGIEVPNSNKVTVHLRDLLENRSFKNYKSKVAFAVGKDIAGKTIITDIAKMPHLLIAGATGSGKSVCLNTLIMSILYKAKPDEVKMIMIDPKMVEMSIYKGIPHLLIPVVTDPKKASGALNWAVSEMTSRYEKFSECQVRDIRGYNQKIDDLEKMGENPKGSVEKMPQIVIIIDELADLMMVSPGEVEDAIVRLSQLARAAGIHLVIATQRPSVNVITGLIKANVPSRIALSVSSGVDSRTIIDMNGAEKLLGNGDMLFYPAGYPKPVRVQGAFVSDEEISRVVEFLKENEDVAVYNEDVAQKIENKILSQTMTEDRDELFESAARFYVGQEKATIGSLQRTFKIGFNRAGRIVDQLYEAGIVGPDEGTKPRKVLMSEEQLEQYFADYL